MDPKSFLDGLTPVGRRLIKIADTLSEHHSRFIPAREILKEIAVKDLNFDEYQFEEACEKLDEGVSPIESCPPESLGFIYRTLLSLGQTWKIRYPFFDLYGPVGDIHDDEPSGPGGVEVRLSKFSNIISPAGAPPLLPVSLLNGFHIPGRGYLPPHQIDELWMAFEEIRQNPGVALEDLMEIIPGPDFSSGCVAGTPGMIRDLYETGAGRLMLRGTIETLIEGPRTKIAIRSIPPGVLVKDIMEQIRRIIHKGLIVYELKDRTEGNRIEVLLDVPGRWTVNDLKTLLFKESDLEKEVGFCIPKPLENSDQGFINCVKWAVEKCSSAWEFKGGASSKTTTPFLRDILKYGGYKSPLYDLSDERRSRLLDF